MIWNLFWDISESHGLWIKICVCLHAYICSTISGNHYPWAIISTSLTWWWAQKGVQKSTRHTTAESLQCSRETVSLLASSSAQASHLRPNWAPGGSPPHGILRVPLSEWVWVRGKPTWEQGCQRHLQGCEITAQNQNHDTVPPLPGSEGLPAEGCLIRSMRCNPGGRSHPHAGESLHLSLHIWARDTVSWTWGASRHSPFPEAS